VNILALVIVCSGSSLTRAFLSRPAKLNHALPW